MTHESISKTFQVFIAKEGGINKGCKAIEKKLKGKWTWKYLYHVYRGTVKPSGKLVHRLRKLRKPLLPRKRYRIKIEGTKEEVDYWKPFTMGQRREALNNMRKENNVTTE